MSTQTLTAGMHIKAQMNPTEAFPKGRTIVGECMGFQPSHEANNGGQQLIRVAVEGEREYMVLPSQLVSFSEQPYPSEQSDKLDPASTTGMGSVELPDTVKKDESTADKTSDTKADTKAK